MGDEFDDDGAQPNPGIVPQQPLNFSPPKAFKGKEEDFELFSYKLKAFLNLAHAGFRIAMSAATQEDAEIDFNTLNAERQAMAIQLQNALITLTDGLALRIVKRQEQSENGFEAWRQLCLR